MTPLAPGATLGLLGGGQLGRMFALAARPLGYRVHLLAPEEDCPAAVVVDQHTVADYLDADAVERFAGHVDAITYEFENIPLACAELAERWAPVRPRPGVLATAQHRSREKTTLEEHGFPVGPFHVVQTARHLEAAVSGLGTPGVLKTAMSGYDGKGQVRIDDPGKAADAWASLDQQECVYEAWVTFERELSVVVARDIDGHSVVYGPMENTHSNHILDISVCPARVDASVAEAARKLGHDVAEGLDVVGVICIELFQLADGGLLVNEIAPRPHNSGHLTIEAHITSQFAQQVRAVAGMPLGSAAQRSPAAMANLLGNVWQGGTPDWRAALAMRDVALHLYQKHEPHVGRKMGHVTVLAEDADAAVQAAVAARRALARGTL